MSSPIIIPRGRQKVNRSKHADKITLTGFMVMLLGAAGADSPGNGYLIAGAVVLAGCILIAVGQWMERKAQRRGHNENR